MSETYATLIDALSDIARRSFYESAVVYKRDDRYTVTDWHTGVEEMLDWTYEDGVTMPPHAIDRSRLHEPYEYYDSGEHVLYHLDSETVERIESGDAIGFTYAVAEAQCECDPEEYPDGCPEDHAAGWVLVVTLETMGGGDR